jgi:hypothetical protein
MEELMTNPAFLLKAYDPAAGQYETLGGFRKITPGVADLFNFEARGILFSPAGLDRLNTFCINHTIHEFMLSFEDGHKEISEFQIKKVIFAGQLNGEDLFDIQMIRVITIQPNNNGEVKFIDPLREAVEKALPIFANMIEDYDQLLACGDCGNRYGDETRFEMQTLRDHVTAIRNAMEIMPNSL